MSDVRRHFRKPPHLVFYFGAGAHIDARPPPMPRIPSVFSARLVKGDDGWVARRGGKHGFRPSVDRLGGWTRGLLDRIRGSFPPSPARRGAHEDFGGPASRRVGIDYLGATQSRGSQPWDSGRHDTMPDCHLCRDLKKRNPADESVVTTRPRGKGILPAGGGHPGSSNLS